MAKILFFGVLTDVCQTSPFSSSTSSVNDLKKELNTRFPKLENYKFNIAVNQQIVKDDIELNENDEVALLPPYSGG